MFLHYLQRRLVQRGPSIIAFTEEIPRNSTWFLTTRWLENLWVYVYLCRDCTVKNWLPYMKCGKLTKMMNITTSFKINRFYYFVSCLPYFIFQYIIHTCFSYISFTELCRHNDSSVMYSKNVRFYRKALLFWHYFWWEVRLNSLLFQYITLYSQ
jgi:hypothetical protein